MTLIGQLQPLQPNSGKQVSSSVIAGMTQSLTRARYQIMMATSNPRGAGFIYVPTNGASALPREVSARRKLMTVAIERPGNFTSMLNDQLLGGETYPILTFVLGTAAGVVSGGAGLLFSVATTALSLTQTAQRVLARSGDELWQVEEIGRVGNNVVHVGAYFLYDPNRNAAFSGGNGWLFHEERTVLSV